MKTIIGIIAMLTLGAGIFFCSVAFQAPPPPPMPAQEQPEVLTSGPVHEAFAEPVNLQIQAGLVISDQPPRDIDEIPPPQRPRGGQYVWVPGYWSWDGDQNNFIWVSGCWRVAPPNMYWVPGYWSRVSEGWEWVAGYWSTADVRNIEYLPPPPEYYYMPPPGPPPSPDYLWVPPCPYWYEDGYVIRPGYWLAQEPDWVWVPSHYDWTPRGYIFCEGYWDYPFQDRGVLFAPVYFPSDVYYRPRYSYSPTIVLDLDIVIGYLFTYPRYCHYYFGDYYDNTYISVGIFPVYEVDRYHTWYDPIFVYDRWRHRDNPHWDQDERDNYDRIRADRDLRPSRTYQDMQVRQENVPERIRERFRMAQPLSQLAQSKETPLKFEQMNTRTQQNVTKQATQARNFGEKRNRWEAVPEGQKAPVQPPTEQRVPVTRPEEPQRIEPQPPGRREQMTQPGETGVPFVPPHEVRVTKPEQQKVPSPPIVGRRATAEKAPPPRPEDEHKYQGEQKGKGKQKQTGR